MRLFADEHIARSIIGSLVAAGHDVVAIADRATGASDADNLRMAIADQRGILTYDSDYVDLVFHEGHAAPETIVYVRMDPRDTRAIAERLVPVLRMFPATSRMIVVEKERVRTREFPATRGSKRD